MAARFHRQVREQIAEELRPTLEPIVETLSSIEERIRELDTEIERLARDDYPETNVLRQVDRVGLRTALRYVLTVEDPFRIRRSRDVGAYFGMQPRRRQSGLRDPEMRITSSRLDAVAICDVDDTVSTVGAVDSNPAWRSVHDPPIQNDRIR